MKGQLTTGIGANPFSLRDGAGALFRRRALVLCIFLIVVVGTAIVTFLLPNKFESRMKILVKNQRADVVITPQQTGGAQTPVVESEVSENQINSEIELLTSKDLLTQVVKDCDLAKLETGLLGRSAPEGVREESAANRLSKDQKHLKLNHPTGATDFFKDKADEYESQLRQAEQRLTDFQQNNNLVVLSQQKDLTLQKTADAKSKMLESETALKEATDRIARIEQQLAAMPKRVVTQSRQLPNQYSAERLNTMIVELQNRRTQLLTKFRPDDRLVRELDDQIRNTREALAHAE